ncbi:MAG: fibronectin type III domain-containing protein, partial [Candidatus Heimdallarchaeota archaeon]|nr:fibronectin type III domain-containing protein [Candidatus Heimdallarchaeota archaeon]
SAEISATPAGIPSAITDLSSTSSGNQVNLIWTSPVNNGGSVITSYKIYRSITSGMGYILISSTSTLNYVDSPVSLGTYYYVVTAINSVGESPNSNEVSATTSSIPTPPTNLFASVVGSDISLTWTAPTDNGGTPIIQYKIYRTTTSGIGYTYLGTSVTTSMLDSTTSPGVTYYYIVTAINTNGESGYSNEVSITRITTPNTPTGLTAQIVNGNVSLTWTAPSDGGSSITQYKVYRSTTSGSGYTLLGASTTTSYLDTTITIGINYYYVVTAINSVGESGYSNQAMASDIVVPTPPLNLSGFIGAGTATLTWDAPSSNGGSPITEYKIYRSNTSLSGYEFRGSSTTLTYYDSPVVTGVTYYYVITAVNTIGESGFSNEASIVEINVPSAVNNLYGSLVDGVFTLYWNPPTSDGGSPITGYRVYRTTTSGSGHALVTTTTNYNYSDNSIISPTVYYYIVAAFNSAGEGAWSNEVSTVDSSPPSPPLNLSGELDVSNYVVLTWNTPSSTGGSEITEYNIYRSTDNGNTFNYWDNTTMLSYTDMSTTIGNTYLYYVTALNSFGESQGSNTVTVVISNLPSVPFDLTSSSSSTGIELSWSHADASSVSGYRIYRASNSGGSYALIGTSTSQSFLDNSVLPGGTYYYVVSAYNTQGESQYSTELIVNYVTEPAPPISLSVVEDDGNVVLSWNHTDSDGGSTITEYKIYRSTDGSTFIFIGSTTSLSYTDSNVEEGNTYTYVVTAVNAIGESSYSESISITISEVGTDDENDFLSLLPINIFAFISALFIIIPFISTKRRNQY